ncbi:lipopolysaccharide assembly protein LapA domain-containing protein [Glaciecola sp. 2405UD65-10]|uniref:lipopolysaccharide assembly protein LapA domain-containing protein n=1 Tax=Glaciecola sp. 2405UD65-10 TaxID=3397244 RepID=UPI003B5A0ABF
MKGIVLVILVIFMLLTAIVVGSRNADVVTINYLIAQVDMRISTFMVVCLFVGFFIGVSTILTKYLSLKVRFASLKKRLDKLSVEKSS